MESGIQEAIISILDELAALLHKANQLLDVVIEQEQEQKTEEQTRRRPKRTLGGF